MTCPCASRFRSPPLNMGPKVHSAGLAKVLKLLITILTTLGCHKWAITAQKCDKVTFALRKNLGFKLFSKRRGPKTCRHSHLRITALPIQLCNRQTDLTNSSAEHERQTNEKLSAIWNFKCFEKIPKLPLISKRKLAETKIGTARHSSECCYND